MEQLWTNQKNIEKMLWIYSTKMELFALNENCYVISIRALSQL